MNHAIEAVLELESLDAMHKRSNSSLTVDQRLQRAQVHATLAVADAISRLDVLTVKGKEE